MFGPIFLAFGGLMIAIGFCYPAESDDYVSVPSYIYTKPFPNLSKTGLEDVRMFQFCCGVGLILEYSSHIQIILTLINDLLVHTRPLSVLWIIMKNWQIELSSNVHGEKFIPKCQKIFKNFSKKKLITFLIRIEVE